MSNMRMIIRSENNMKVLTQYWQELLVSFITSISPAEASQYDQPYDAYLTDQAYCLAENVYHEARNQPADKWQ